MEYGEIINKVVRSRERNIKKLCPKAKMLSGLAIRGGRVDRADKDVASWLNKLDLLP